MLDSALVLTPEMTADERRKLIIYQEVEAVQVSKSSGVELVPMDAERAMSVGMNQEEYKEHVDRIGMLRSRAAASETRRPPAELAPPPKRQRTEETPYRAQVARQFLDKLQQAKATAQGDRWVLGKRVRIPDYKELTTLAGMVVSSPLDMYELAAVMADTDLTMAAHLRTLAEVRDNRSESGTVRMKASESILSLTESITNLGLPETLRPKPSDKGFVGPVQPDKEKVGPSAADEADVTRSVTAAATATDGVPAVEVQESEGASDDV